MPYTRPNIVAGVTRATKAFFDNLLDGIDENRRRAAPRPILIATRLRTGNLRQATSAAQSLSAGTSTLHTTRVRHIATTAAHSVQIAYGDTVMGEPGPNPITVKAALEYAAGAIVPAFFHGGRTVTVQPSGLVLTDPMPVESVPGVLIRSRQMVQVSTLGEKWPVSAVLNTSVGDGGASTDTVDGGNMPDNNGAAVFAPTALIGIPYDPNAVALFAPGDSIIQGVGDSGAEPTTDGGWVARALNGQIPFVNVGRASETADQFVPGNTRRLGRMQLADYCTHALVGYGINDVKGDATVAQIQARLTARWTELAARGLKVLQPTLTPVTTGTFATPEGQVKQSASREAVRIAVNDWIRTTPAPLTDYVEIADAVETARNSGIWKNNYTGDGTHPSPEGAAAAAAGSNLIAKLTV
ncbi:minor tail protein [Gordonia phage Keitabear]|uniref:Minor tail protein n=1 Tax=Gordonia phage Keitabear TaxID=2653274 RepID=A0A5P8D646_9CAUD|nr:lysophospholipase L1-like esterase [Gordonia phage Keitabear]QFP94468.1 minor tail protein [Gordonia phage Keitabear]